MLACLPSPFDSPLPFLSFACLNSFVLCSRTGPAKFSFADPFLFIHIVSKLTRPRRRRCYFLFSLRRFLVANSPMSRVYVGNLDPRATERELEDEFRVYGVLRRSDIFHLSSCASHFFASGDDEGLVGSLCFRSIKDVLFCFFFFLVSIEGTRKQ